MEYFSYTIMDALKQNCCPVCYVVKQREEQAFWWFFNDNYHDGQVLADLIDNPSFCDDHASYLRDSDHAALSFFLQVMVMADMEKLQRLKEILSLSSPKPNGNFRASLNRLAKKRDSRKEELLTEITEGHVSCRFCRMRENASLYVAGEFVRFLEDEEGQTLYKDSSGFCRRHLLEVLRLCNGKATWKFLINDTIRRLNALHNEFELYFHHMDSRFSHGSKDEEQDTWLFALKFYAGIKTNDGDPSKQETRR